MAIETTTAFRSVSATAFTTCGELIQGRIEGRDLMVTLPVRECVRATASHSNDEGVLISPPSKIKARMICELLADRTRTFGNVKIDLDSPVPIARGYGSSSADMIAAGRAFAAYHGLTITDDYLLSVCAEIEPTDAVAYGHPTLFDYVTGDVLEHFPDCPTLELLVIDSGAAVVTTDLTRLEYDAAEVDSLAGALDLVREGCRQHDVRRIGRGASVSTRVNERRLPKERLTLAFDVADRFGGHGVSAAHSGSTLSIIFGGNQIEARDRAYEAMLAAGVDVTRMTAGSTQLGSKFLN